MDNLIARILLKTDLKIVTTGGEIERILEQGGIRESRVINRAGKWTVRQVLAFAEHREMVIGPETGVLNAVSMLPMPKIVFCPIRRTKTRPGIGSIPAPWSRKTRLATRATGCITPGTTASRTRATGTAVCQVNIDLERAWDAVESKLRKAA